MIQNTMCEYLNKIIWHILLLGCTVPFLENTFKATKTSGFKSSYNHLKHLDQLKQAIQWMIKYQRYKATKETAKENCTELVHKFLFSFSIRPREGQRFLFYLLAVREESRHVIPVYLIFFLMGPEGHYLPSFSILDKWKWLSEKKKYPTTPWWLSAWNILLFSAFMSHTSWPVGLELRI